MSKQFGDIFEGLSAVGPAMPSSPEKISRQQPHTFPHAVRVVDVDEVGDGLVPRTPSPQPTVDAPMADVHAIVPQSEPDVIARVAVDVVFDGELPGSEPPAAKRQKVVGKSVPMTREESVDQPEPRRKRRRAAVAVPATTSTAAPAPAKPTRKKKAALKKKKSKAKSTKQGRKKKTRLANLSPEEKLARRRKKNRDSAKQSRLRKREKLEQRDACILRIDKKEIRFDVLVSLLKARGVVPAVALLPAPALPAEPAIKKPKKKQDLSLLSEEQLDARRRRKNRESAQRSRQRMRDKIAQLPALEAHEAVLDELISDLERRLAAARSVVVSSAGLFGGVVPAADDAGFRQDADRDSAFILGSRDS